MLSLDMGKGNDMYCRYCGKELRGDPNYCRYCGGQLYSVDMQDKTSCISLEQHVNGDEFTEEEKEYCKDSLEEAENINNEEMCTIYLEDSSSDGLYENPATYAHEILYLYGALDLYDGASPQDINNYVIETYPYEIMLSTYNETLIPNEYDEVKTISPITAYMLNWIDDIEELTWFPEMEREDGACFSEKDFGGYYFNDEENKEFDEVDPGRS